MDTFLAITFELFSAVALTLREIEADLDACDELAVIDGDEVLLD